MAHIFPLMPPQRATTMTTRVSRRANDGRWRRATAVVVSVLALVVVVCGSEVVELGGEHMENHSLRELTAPTRRVVAVGDVHGDLAQLMAVLQMAEVIDREGKWVDRLGTTVVQVGDLMDRGPHDKAVLDFMMRLQGEAAAHGGRVVVLLGNHEVMNLMGQFHYVHPESHEDFGGRHNRKREFGPQRSYGKWLRQLPIVQVVGSSVFVHAGLSPEFLERVPFHSVNERAAAALAKGAAIVQEDPIFGTSGPVWTRLLITDAMNGRCDDVVRALHLVGDGVRRMVVGHTPQRSGRIETYCDDRLIAVDVGLSKWMYGKLAALEILEFDVSSDGRESRVELREIVPHTGVEEHRDTGPAVEPKTKASGDATTTTDAALGSDPMLLQELLEVIQEAKTREKLRDAAANEKVQHEEL